MYGKIHASLAKCLKLFLESLRPKYHIVTVTVVAFCDSVLWRLKAVTMRLVLESFKSPSLFGFFVTICDLVYFYTSLNNFLKHFCFWWSNITSLINFGSNSMLAVFKQFNTTFLSKNYHKKHSKIFTKGLLRKSQKVF
jgi:hypothetical protein